MSVKSCSWPQWKNMEKTAFRIEYIHLWKYKFKPCNFSDCCAIGMHYPDSLQDGRTHFSAAECCWWDVSVGMYLLRRAAWPETCQSMDVKATPHSIWAAAPTLIGHPSFWMPSAVETASPPNFSPPQPPSLHSPASFPPSHKWAQEHSLVNLRYSSCVSE